MGRDEDKLRPVRWGSYIQRLNIKAHEYVPQLVTAPAIQTVTRRALIPHPALVLADRAEVELVDSLPVSDSTLFRFDKICSWKLNGTILVKCR